MVIIKRLVVGSLSANCYIVGSEATREGLIIDPGGNAEDTFKAAAGLDIKIIVLTHGHSDHVAALYDIQDETGAEVAIHTADAQFLHGRGAFSMMFGISYRTPEPPDRLLNEGDIIDIGDLHLTVLHTPGHTPGSLCFKLGRHLISGDTIFPGGPGNTRSPDALRQIIKSITEIVFILPDDTRIYPGHGDATVLKKEKDAFAIFAARPHSPNLCGNVLWLSS